MFRQPIFDCDPVGKLTRPFAAKSRFLQLYTRRSTMSEFREGGRSVHPNPYCTTGACDPSLGSMNPSAFRCSNLECPRYCGRSVPTDSCPASGMAQSRQYIESTYRSPTNAFASQTYVTTQTDQTEGDKRWEVACAINAFNLEVWQANQDYADAISWLNEEVRAHYDWVERGEITGRYPRHRPCKVSAKRFVKSTHNLADDVRSCRVAWHRRSESHGSP